MSSTAHKTEAEYVEHFDPPSVFEEKVTLLAKWIQEAKHFTAFTGAGISTSAGVADFRSGMNTVLPTGPGAWTKRAEVEKGSAAAVEEAKKQRTVVSTLKAVPTKTHMAIVELINRGILKYLISQNTDGLHRRSGVPADRMSELHGNSNLEICKKCGHHYLRDFRTRTQHGVKDHLTGRKCSVSGCGGPLEDTIINFGENLPEAALQFGYAHSYTSDLCLSMGSSLRVTPAADLPAIVAKHGRLVVVNLQSTPLDEVAALRINAKTDDVMVAVMAKLGLDIPEFRLTRYLRVTTSVADSKEGKEKKETKALKLAVEGVESDGVPFSLFKSVEATFPTANRTKALSAEPHTASCALEPLVKAKETAVQLKLEFFGHYTEPSCTVTHKLSLDGPDSQTYRISYSPAERKWSDAVAVKAEELKAKAQLKNVRDQPHKLDMDELVAAMVAMGFKDEESRAALRAEKLDIGDAVHRLVKKSPTKRSSS